MIVYVCIGDAGMYEGEEVHHVASTREKAEDYMKKNRVYRIEEWEVDE